jgi:hypothetical protein
LLAAFDGDHVTIPPPGPPATPSVERIARTSSNLSSGTRSADRRLFDAQSTATASSISSPAKTGTKRKDLPDDTDGEVLTQPIPNETPATTASTTSTSTKKAKGDSQ